MRVRSSIILICLFCIIGILASCRSTRLPAHVNNSSKLKAGRLVYNEYCFTCHGKSGEGSIGPNLSDDYWLHGNTLSDLMLVIVNGVAEKGMPKWSLSLTPEQIGDVAVYVQSMQGTNPKNQKGPQGIQY